DRPELRPGRLRRSHRGGLRRPLQHHPRYRGGGQLPRRARRRGRRARDGHRHRAPRPSAPCAGRRRARHRGLALDGGRAAQDLRRRGHPRRRRLVRRHRGGREGVLGRRTRPAHDLRPPHSGREDPLLRQRGAPPRRGRRLRGRGDDPRRGRVPRRPGGDPPLHEFRARRAPGPSLRRRHAVRRDHQCPPLERGSATQRLQQRLRLAAGARPHGSPRRPEAAGALGLVDSGALHRDVRSPRLGLRAAV
ncbi:MAG: hypothetical protein AVDCRST_MAG17-518, partial [uncultured Solirubrobacterales bacterium]